MPWWDLWDWGQSRLECELDALRDAGISFEQDSEERARGRLVLLLEYPLDGKPCKILARFPEFYPYARIELIAPDLNLQHHQNPVAKNLCVFARHSDAWLPSDTLCSVLQERLPLVIASAKSNDQQWLSTIEVRQAEPVTDYFSYQPESYLLIDSAWALGAAQDGRLKIGFNARPKSIALRGAVLEIKDHHGTILARADDAIRRAYCEKTIDADWYRVQSPPIIRNPDELKTLDRERCSKVNPARVSDGSVRVAALVFPEEREWRIAAGDGYLFLVRAPHGVRYARKGRKTSHLGYLARAVRLGQGDFFSRAPELTPLAEKRIAVVGVGCVGAPSALEFAKAGLKELRLVDGDAVDAGNSLRWPLGIAAAGTFKVDALEGFIRANFPRTSVQKWNHRIGDAFAPQESKFLELLEGVDLLYDATAEPGIQYLLSELARRSRIPYVWVSATQGGWGGRVARTRPGSSDACWSCVQAAETSGEIPPPPGRTGEPVQPVGCASPTFTGANFDIMEVALCAVRLAVSTLCYGTNGGYPDPGWNVGVLRIRSAMGELGSPVWTSHRVECKAECAARNEL
ncbi:MAG: HesA/MoeB/ThiF family protein [Candidatus Acidiferrales bacterium]